MSIEDNERQKRDEQEKRNREILIHTSKKNQCTYCCNSALLTVTDSKYNYVFICDKCNSNDVFKYPVGRNFEVWDARKYPNLKIWSLPIE